VCKKYVAKALITRNQLRTDRGEGGSGKEGGLGKGKEGIKVVNKKNNNKVI